MRRMKPFGISARLNLIFLAFGFLLLLSFLVPAYFVARNILQNNALAELHAISLQKQLTLEGWLSTTKSVIYGIIQAPQLQESIQKLLDSSPGSPERQQSAAEVADGLRSWIGIEQGFDAFSVVDQDSGLVLASTDPAEIGVEVSTAPYFIHGKTELYIQPPFYSRPINGPLMRISLPMKMKDGQAIAVLAVRIRLNKMIEIIARGLTQDTSDDVYLVNSARLVVVPPRSRPYMAILIDMLDTEAIDRCIQGQSGEMATKDYRGIPVISSYTWLPDRNMCLIVEKSQVEAYASIQRLSRITLITAGVALLLDLLLSYFLARMFTKPIYQLLQGVKQFSMGQLDHEIDIHADGDIKALANAFNEMAANLSHSIEKMQQSALENLRLYQEAKDHVKIIEREQELHAKLFDNSTSLISVMDSQGLIIDHNRACEILLGLDGEEIHGKNYESLLISPHGMFGGTLKTEELVARGFPKLYETDFVTKDGQRRTIAWSSDASYNSSGQLEYILSVGIDVTENRRMEEKLRISERNFQTALAAAPISIYTLDRDYRITFMHDPHPDFHLEDFVGKRIDEAIETEQPQELLSIQTMVFETEQAQRGLIAVKTAGELRYYSYYAKPIKDSSGLVTGLACAGYDITELKKTEHALVEIKNNLEQIVAEKTYELRQSEKILQTTLNALPEVAALLNRDGKLIYGNQALADSLCISSDLLTNAYIFDFFPPDVAALRKAKVDEAFASGLSIRFTDTRGGRFFDNILHPILDENDQASLMAVLAIDVTDWKVAQDALAAGRERLKTLARKAVVAQEEERRRISRELHDEAGQALTALSISLKLYSADLPEGYVEGRKRMSDAISLVDNTIEQIRALAQGLRPQAVDALGLGGAIEGYCRDFSRRTKINIEYQGLDVPPLPDITNVTLFRFLQEALTNAARHSKAAKITVSLSLNGDVLKLAIQDDGIGFEMDSLGGISSSNSPNGIGLQGMKERSEMIGGKIEIISGLGQGTTLVAIVNIKGDPIERNGLNDQSNYC